MHVCVCVCTYTYRCLQISISGKQSLTDGHPSIPSFQPHKESSLCLVFPRSLCSQGNQGNERKKDRGHQSWKEKKVKVTQSCLTLCDPMDCIDHGILQARILEGVAFPFSRGSSQPGVEPKFPTLQVDSLTAELQGKPKNTGVGSLSLLQPFSSGSTRPRNQTRVSCIAGGFFTN